MNEFKETYNRFRSALVDMEYDSYWEWMLLSDDFKAVALYVKFYTEITLAWNKTVKPFMEEETAISTLMQYLLKNVPVIQDDRKRFTANYLYRVAFNAFYPLGQIKRDEQRWRTTRSLYAFQEDGRNTETWLDTDNLMYSESHYSERAIVDAKDIFYEADRKAIWMVIESGSEEMQRFVEAIINGQKLGKKLTKKAPQLISELRHKLCVYCE